MFNLFEEINSLKSLFLLGINEPVDNRLLIKVKESIALDQNEFVKVGTKSIGPIKKLVKTGKSRGYSIFFRSYAAYSIFDESYLIAEDKNDCEGRLLCVYAASRYLDFVRARTFMETIRQEELKCYAVNCVNHAIFIASSDEPVVARL